MRSITLVFASMLLIAGCSANPAPQNHVGTTPSETSSALDLSSPEATMAGYFDSLRAGDSSGIRQRYLGRGFKVKRPVPIVSHTITKKTVYGQTEVDLYNTIPPPMIDDVELDVRVVEAEQTYMATYVLREVDEKWYIYSHAVWGAP